MGTQTSGAPVRELTIDPGQPTAAGRTRSRSCACSYRTFLAAPNRYTRHLR